MTHEQLIQLVELAAEAKHNLISLGNALNEEDILSAIAYQDSAWDLINSLYGELHNQWQKEESKNGSN